MPDDDEHKPHHATARPPPGEEDVYSASTVVGEASDEILAIIRGTAAEKDAPKEQPKENTRATIPGNAKVPTFASEPKVEVAKDIALEEPKDDKPLAPGANIPTPAVGKPAYAPTPLDVPVTKSVEVVSDEKADAPIEKAAAAPIARDEPDPNFKKGTMPPALGIVLFFVVVVVVLAALIR